MPKKEIIKTASGFQMQVETQADNDEISVSLNAPADRPCVLHWGARRHNETQWQLPPQSSWPPGSQLVGQAALETPFSRQNGQAGLVIKLSPASAYESLNFAFFFPDEKRWDNNKGRDYQIMLTNSPAQVNSLPDAFHSAMPKGEALFERFFDIEGQWQLGAAVVKSNGTHQVFLLTNVPGELLLHWGIARQSPQEWLLPPEGLRPPGTVLWQNQTAQTTFAQKAGLNSAQFEFPEADLPLGLQFVLKRGENGRWLKQSGANFYVPIRAASPSRATQDQGQFAGLADEIVRAETTHNSWTLMHRFNLCHDLLDRVRGNPGGYALLYAWLRFSAIRQLTWQRNYNTQPRELAHAQDRLTQKLAGLYGAETASRPLLRLMLGSVGRGGEGQRIRDEILNIMHRHHVKEVSGHFMEEWHQKLHNNTTPDDIVICEAFLEFLRSNGNLDRFYQTLSSGGVTRQRLESFERPIRSNPQFVPHLKDGLIGEFQNFLKILKASHSATDFETALNAARGQLDGDLQGKVGFLWDHRNDQGVPIVEFVRRIAEARRRLCDLLNRSQGTRELLYLDLALEQLLRRVVERNIHLQLPGDQLADLLTSVLENLKLSDDDPELTLSSRHWERLQSLPRFDVDWSLHAKSVVDRIGRALSGWIDHFYQLLQPKAEYLGQGFQAEGWTITLFSEEVVRGNSLGFVVSVLLKHLDPILRQSARIGNWQIVSRGRGSGKLEVVDALRSIQHRRFDSPTVIISDQVMGDEEIPEGVTAVIAPDVTDIVSHVAVRARNASLLFASCHDPETFERLKALRGKFVSVEINPAGDVVVQETDSSATEPAAKVTSATASIRARHFTKYAVTLEEFSSEIVGGKSSHLAELRNWLPDWIGLPASVAVPFGVFEKVLGLSANEQVSSRYTELVKQAADGKPEALADVRKIVLDLAPPPELATALHETMNHAGLAWPSDWDMAWQRIKQVWASKWNDRAFLSRNKMGIPHDRLTMAVLIQQVVPADYAFVLHTVNPSNGNTNELFGEMVLGLGETLVGNYPGRALSFVWNRSAKNVSLLSYPGKSIGLYGGGLIFRSDSNGEDLENFAGAGLYDSVLLEDPKRVPLDYSQEPLIWDKNRRDSLLAKLAGIGLEVERALGSPQDIEGAVAKDKFFLVQTRPQVGVGEDAPPR